MAPKPTPLTLEIDRSIDPSPVYIVRITSNGVLTQIGTVSAAGVWTPTGPGGGTFAASAYTDTTNAGNISSGTLPAARLPAPTTTTLGGVLSGAAPLNQFQTGISATGAPTFAQVPFTSLSGQISAAQVPSALALNSPSLTGTPSTPGLTGYLYGNGGTGWTASPTVPFTNLSGTIANGQIASGLTYPGAILTGSPSTPGLTGYLYGNAASGWTAATTIPTSALSGVSLPSGITGSSLTSVGTIATGTWNGTRIGLSFEAQAPAGTLRGNLTGGLADVADSTLTAHMDAAFGSTRGAILYRGATGWTNAAPATSGYVWTSNGAGADPGYKPLAAATAVAPQVTSYLSGSGTYTTPTGASRLEVEGVGGGQGGGAGGTGGTNSITGSAGTDTTFGPITAPGGASATAQAGTADFFARGSGAGGSQSGGSTAFAIGGVGGATIYGGGGTTTSNGAGGAGSANTGAGGGGGGATATNGTTAGTGGQSGTGFKAIITSPAASYSYSVGGGGAPAAAGTNGSAGGTGAAGRLRITAYFN